MLETECFTGDANETPSKYQNVNFGDESSFRIDSKSKIDLQNYERRIQHSTEQKM